ncbi:MAG: A/G-specific adenine glycosylase [Firmicutes bacterium]|nr:A/G-specific adenine glycosylase [Bacillota bacterium]
MNWPESASLLAPLAAWFDRNRRTLPWRAEDLSKPHPDPYAVLVSELMLQQTQVATVIPYFQRWMEGFPDAATLARADADALHKAWEGLGYYRRARHLQAAAQKIAEHGWPADLEGLLTLPGLGPYTAAAVASIAFQQPEAALDGNAFRVLARVLGLEDDPTRHAKSLRHWLKPALETLGPSRLTQAVMELGALVCTPSPRCEQCPLAACCEARRMDATERIPLKKDRAPQKESEIWLLAIRAQGRWLLRPPASKGLLAGLWSWPVLPLEKPVANLAAEPQQPFGLESWRSWPGWTQVYSHRKERIQPLALEWSEAFPVAQLRWVEEETLRTLPMGKRDQRLRELLDTSSQGLEAPPIARLLRRLSSMEAGELV